MANVGDQCVDGSPDAIGHLLGFQIEPLSDQDCVDRSQDMSEHSEVLSRRLHVEVGELFAEESPVPVVPVGS